MNRRSQTSWGFVLLVLTQIGWVCAGWSQSTVGRTLQEEAETLYREGHYDEAATLHRKIIRLYPKDIKKLKQSMWALWNMEDYEEAAQIARQVLALHAHDPEATNIIAWAPHAENREKINTIREQAIANYQAGRFEEAAKLYQQLVELEPGNETDLRDEMWALWYMKRYPAAIAVASSLLKIQKDDAEALSVLAQAPDAIHHQQTALQEESGHEAQLQKENAEAIEAYKALSRENPQNPDPLRNLAELLFRLDRNTDAAATTQQLLQLRPRDASAWKLLGKIQMTLDQPEEALSSYEKSLEIKPHQPQVIADTGRLYIQLRDLQKGIALLEPLAASGQVDPNDVPILAKALFYHGDYAQSAVWWEKAVALFPDHFGYRYNEAQALFYSGTATGRAKMEELSKLYSDPKATEFLVSDAIARGLPDAAARMRENQLTSIQASDDRLVFRLVNLYQAMGQSEKSLALLDRLLQVAPDQQRALVIKGGILMEQEHYLAAEKAYRRAIALNPYASKPLLGLAECEFSTGQDKKALATIAQARRVDPTNPYILLREARYVYDSGNPQRSKKLLTDWLNSKDTSVQLPVLLYHGLTNHPQDPLLADETMLSLEIFSDQIRAISEAGYTSVTAEQVSDWMSGKSELPPKPILITFDDARRDSFQLADPILETYHFKATMFIPIVNVEGNRPIAYASWPEIEHYAQTGRWEIESHGDIAHIHIPINAQNQQTLFITARQWLADQNRLETIDEWQQRVAPDHERVNAKIYQHTGIQPTAYAYPDGEYGQDGTNTPDIIPLNLALVRKNYTTAYIEDYYGFNVRSQDPVLMTRLQPRQDLTGMGLTKQLRDQNPRVLMYQELLNEAVWEDRPREAYQWLAQMNDANVSENEIWSAESRIRFMLGDVNEGRALASRVLSENPTHYENMIESQLAKEGPAWSPGFQYQEDNNRRRNWAEDQVFDLPPMGQWAWRLEQRYAEFRQPGVDTVIDNGVGLGADVKLGLYHNLSFDAMGHFLSGQAHDNATAAASLQSEWTDNFRTHIEAGHSIYDTAEALNNNVIQTYGNVLGQWSGEGRWSATARVRGAELSDDNRRLILQPEIARSFFKGRHLKLSYRFTYDDMRFISPAYYSPQELKLHEIGPEYERRFGSRVDLFMKYRPGLGAEEHQAYTLSQDAEVRIQIKVGSQTWITPLFSYNSTPNYFLRTYQILLRHHFGPLANLGVPVAQEENP